MAGIPSSMDAEMVCDHLRNVKKSSGMTDKEMADAYGVCQSYMSKLLAGDAKPGEKILKALGMKKVVYYEWA